MNPTIAGLSVSTLGLYAFAGLAVIGSPIAAPVLLISCPAGLLLALTGDQQ